MAKGFKIADAYVEINVDDAAAKAAIRGMDRSIGGDAEKAGRGVGESFSTGLGDEAEKGGTQASKRNTEAFTRQSSRDRGKFEKSGRDNATFMSKAMSLSFLRNAPLVTAVASAALIAGAPLMVGAAGLLFGGIAVVAAAQNDTVRAGFTALWDHVKTGTENAAATILPSMNRITVSLGHTFDSLTPAMTRAFAASGPLIEKLTTGVERFATGAMPGMVHAVEAGGPVFDGLSNFLASTGTGLGHFFDLIAEHGPASGQVFSSLGSIIQSLLGILGDLSGQGAEIGGVMLPMVATALGVVADALHMVAPVLPIVVAGFSAFKLASAASGYLSIFGKQLSFVAGVAGPMGGTLSTAGRAVAGMASALPILGTAAIAVGMAFSAQSQQIDGWSGELMKGGAAAAKATADMKHQADSWGFSNLWGQFKEGISQLKGYSSSTDEATQKMKAQLAAMDPITRAQTVLTGATNDLSFAIAKHGQNSDEAKFALFQYKNAENDVKVASEQEELAIHGVTQAMVDQANEAMSAIDSNFALQHAQNQQRDALIQLRDAIKQHGAASIQAHDAQQAYAESIYNNAKAVGTLAADESGAKKGTVEYAQALDKNMLSALLRVRDTLTGPARAAVDGWIKKLQDAGVTTDGLTGKSKTLGAQKPVVTPTMNPAPFNSTYTDIMGRVHTVAVQKPTPQVGLLNLAGSPLAGILSQLHVLDGYTAHTKVVNDTVNYITTLYNTSVARGNASGGPIHAASGKLVGPGNGTVDTIPAVNVSTGAAWMLANDEWVINAAESNRQGDAKMAALNAGQADIVPRSRGQQQSTNPVTGTGIRVDNLTVQIAGTFDFGNPAAAQKAAVAIRDELVKLERSYR